MNLNLNTVTRYLKKISYGDRLRPFRDWVVIVVVTLLLIAAVASWSYFLFVRISNGEMLGATPNATSEEANTSLETVQSTFAERATERAHYRADYRFVDPSR